MNEPSTLQNQADVNAATVSNMMPDGRKQVITQSEYMPDPVQQPGVLSVAQPTVFKMLRSDPRVEAVLGEAKYQEKVEEKSVPAMAARIEDLESKINLLLGVIQGAGIKQAAQPVVAQPDTETKPVKDVREELDALNYQDLRHKAKEMGLTIPRNAKKDDIIDAILTPRA